MTISPDITAYLRDLLPGITGEPVSSFTAQTIGGGSINNCFRILINDSYSFFLKQNDAGAYPGLFEKEKEGLIHLAAQKCITTPRIIFTGTYKKEQLLLMEWISSGLKTGNFWDIFGEQLAALHQFTNPAFGFTHDNYMGALSQQNNFAGNWVDFFITHRLMPQVTLASGKNLLPPRYVDLFHQLYKKLGTIFNEESPSLLHGDLWSGNFICDDQSRPVLIDPAVYYGHRSIDLGMTTLFGGFDSRFYQAYNYHFTFPSNHEEQWEICNLYPLLIHLNLFGQSYLGEIGNILKRLG